MIFRKTGFHPGSSPGQAFSGSCSDLEPTVMALSWAQNALAVASGGAVGFSLGMIGGGSSITRCAATALCRRHDDAHVAIGTSALAVSLNAFGNLIGHWRAGNVKWPCASTF